MVYREMRRATSRAVDGRLKSGENVSNAQATPYLNPPPARYKEQHLAPLLAGDQGWKVRNDPTDNYPMMWSSFYA